MPPLRAFLTATLALAAACARPLPPPPGGAGAPPAAHAALVSSLTVETAGDTVRFTLGVTNPHEAPVPVVFPTGQAYDFAVRGPAGEAWRWSAERMFTQAVQTRTLAPGETWTFAERWVRPAGLRGDFTAVGRLASSSHPVERTTVFRLP